MRGIALGLLGGCWISTLAAAALGPAEVAVVYNSAVPESVKLAKLYAELRQIPEVNLIGLELPVTPDISRSDYKEKLQGPLRREFERRDFWRIAVDPASGISQPVVNHIRVLVTMRGVPLRILPVTRPTPPPVDPTNPAAARDEAAVDSELAMLGVDVPTLDGPMKNLYHRSEVSISEARMPSLMLTARIDAASTATCERMMRDAVEIEAVGLWGMAYVDLADKVPHPEGDKWMEAVASANLTAGIATVVDRFRDTLPKNYPMREAAMYYGWYDWNVSGPFLNPAFRFRKGAVAMHLHSFSAQQLSNRDQNWSAPLLERGAAVTIGNVFEPYLGLTHQFDILHDRLLAGRTWVEAAWASMPATSWQGVVLGDPLYRPFAHFDGSGKMIAENTPFVALRMAALKWGDNPDEMRAQLLAAAERTSSGALTEAIGLRLAATGKDAEAKEYFQLASKRYASPADKMRQDFNQIALLRAAPNGRPVALQALREARLRYGAIPEAEALTAWLTVLDPPPPPPAVPGAKSTKPAPAPKR